MLLQTSDGVVQAIVELKLPRSLTHHALVVYHMMKTQCSVTFEAEHIARACALYAIKERDFPYSAISWKERDDVAEMRTVAVELLLVQIVTGRITLVEGCVRLQLKRLISENNAIVDRRDDVGLLTLPLVQQLYFCNYCLYPESAAAAAILAACHLLELEVIVLPASFAMPFVAKMKADLLSSVEKSCVAQLLK